MQRFIAFDVETPNRRNDRMSAIGVTVIEDGRITDSFFSYVDPQQPFDRFNTELTGISSETVRNAPTFPELWERLRPIFESGVPAAHNASFDLGVLRKCLQDYRIAWKPQVTGLCTVCMGRRLLPGISHRLNDLCAYYAIPLEHHRADSDSRACAELLLRYLAMGAKPEAHFRTYQMSAADPFSPKRRETDRQDRLKQYYRLRRHPEGGWFSEVYTSPFTQDGRALAGSIYFLLDGAELSHFHQIDCDEIWYFHEGCGLRITVLAEGRLRTLRLGGRAEAGEQAMAVIPAGAVFAAENLDPRGYSFLSCATTPAFRYEGFRLVPREELLRLPGAEPALARLAFSAAELAGDG